MISTQQLQEAYARTGNYTAAAMDLQKQGLTIDRRTISRRLAKAQQPVVELGSQFVLESPTSHEPDVHALIQERLRKFEHLRSQQEASKIIRIRVKDDLPIGIGWFGDPHVDDDGTDLDLLFRHAELFDGRTPGLVAACVGDVWNNWVGRLTRLWAEQSTSAAEARALVTEFMRLVDWLIFIKGNHDCLTPDMECLTRRGWKTYDQLGPSDLVLSLNPQTKVAEWVPIQQKITRPHKGEMLTLKGRGYDISMTPNHRVMRQDRHGEYIFTQADQLPEWNLTLPAAGSAQSTYAISDDEIRLAAWCMSDAHYLRATDAITFYQSGDASRIVDILERLGLTPRVVARNRVPSAICGRAVKTHQTAYEVHINAEQGRRVRALVADHEKMPDWVLDLDDRQFELFADELIYCDGHEYEDKKQRTAALHKAVSVLEQWQVAFLSHGWRANLSVNTRGHGVLNLIKKDHVNLNKNQSLSRENYDGLVWCLTVKHGNFMVRRNGQAHFTGNCWSGSNDILDWLLTQNVVASKPTRAQVQLVFPNGKTVEIYASHDFKGRSQWSPSFGPAKKAQLHRGARIYVCGHLHDAAYQHGFHPDGRMWHAVRMASYKKYDEYIEQLDIEACPGYECPVSIIDPQATSEVNLVRWEWCPFEAAERIKWMRKRAAAPARAC